MNIRDVCDHYRWLIFFCIISCSSLYDPTAYHLTWFYKLLGRVNDSPCEEMWIAGDTAYTFSRRFIIRWRGKSPSTHKVFLNYWLSFALVTIKQTFGLLSRRCSVIRISLRVCGNKVSQTVYACCKLHNVIIKRSHLCSALTNGPTDVNRHGKRIYFQQGYTRDEKGLFEV